ncbi:MAG: hypothetical protein KDA20_00900 [Phycisphaerales bacterium]|nr:hypothetical protein [Phycisphaerales bacterium]
MTTSTYVSRGGAKLEHALHEFNRDVTGLVCADLGCSTGGFTDCLLQHGAAKVHAVDTGYGVLEYKLRVDPRVVVHERTNALHMESAEPVDLVVLDLGWTPQRLAIPAALQWLKPEGRIVSLIKPHYEATGPYREQFSDHLAEGVLPDDDAAALLQLVLDDMPALGVQVQGVTQSPVRGSGGKGNIEYLALLTLVPSA